MATSHDRRPPSQNTYTAQMLQNGIITSLTWEQTPRTSAMGGKLTFLALPFHQPTGISERDVALISFKTGIACLLGLALAGCRAERKADDYREPLPDFVKASSRYLELQHEYPDDLYSVSMRNPEGMESPEGAGALIVIDSPSVLVTTWCEAVHMPLVWNADGWTVMAAEPCSDDLASSSRGAKAILLEALRAGAKLTIDAAGDLIITEASGRVIGIGRSSRPMPIAD